MSDNTEQIFLNLILKVASENIVLKHNLNNPEASVSLIETESEELFKRLSKALTYLNRNPIYDTPASEYLSNFKSVLKRAENDVYPSEPSVSSSHSQPNYMNNYEVLMGKNSKE